MAISQERRRTEHEYRHVGELLPPTGFETLITVSVGPDGPVTLWATMEDQADLLGRSEGPGGATFPTTRTSSRPRGALASYSETSLAPEAVTLMGNVPVAHPRVQPLPGGEFLLAGSRCAWREDGAEHNAFVVGTDGEITRTGTLGDGIKHMLVDNDGEIWIGYFDEGIFGNFGWGRRGPRPLGAPGIVRWSPNFEKLWEYQAVDNYRLDDCYALNVDTDRTWACPYSKFPVLQIDDDRTTVHRTTGVNGPRGLVVAGETVGLIGAYKDRDSLLLGSLRGGLSRLENSSLGIPDGRIVPRSVLVCRSSVASLFVGTDWFTFDLSNTL